jgi:membrane-bound metal-dependent hydrolase YbcI (DUF457 family)
MQGKNHIALALAVPLAGSMLTGQQLLPPTAAAWGCLILGSLAPDIDGEGSICYLGNFLPRHITPRPIIKILNWIGRTISSGLRATLGHRAALHAPVWGLIMMGLGLGLFDLKVNYSEWLLWFGLGYLLHLFGDSLTKTGIPVFWPLFGGHISLTPMVTGKFVECTFGILLWLFVAWRIVMDVVLPKSAWLEQILDRFGYFL